MNCIYKRALGIIFETRKIKGGQREGQVCWYFPRAFFSLRVFTLIITLYLICLFDTKKVPSQNRDPTRGMETQIRSDVGWLEKETQVRDEGLGALLGTCRPIAEEASGADVVTPHVGRIGCSPGRDDCVLTSADLLCTMRWNKNRHMGWLPFSVWNQISFLSECTGWPFLLPVFLLKVQLLANKPRISFAPSASTAE